ncbi:acetyl-CoA carboxylase biotin carboxylase subunit [Rhodoligotrophos defluvii]|uniref:acetyl-CoA carboxylase biotin carboxylase subunit n=1 Tax=Rhodoligotrophos defluvii TaxID=2561934 RepID=UPI0010C9BD2C|nr:acetyl/propionyl/methylcrotonyl-CoA carboxylase subunit alpha [Rhodoligotrophos defluvii]
MFDKILIANRGEIACRVIRTAKKMGIATVAVYSDADARALHVREADEAVRIGPAPANQSYLVIDAIIQACKTTGAQAVHPGYGFLSENAAFAKALAENGIVFIGPNVRAIEAMGDKIESKRFADAAGVNTVPGFLGEIETPAEAIRIADEIGYPVMIKASAGGGGKGMRIAKSRDEVKEGFELARAEAKSSFGDERVFIEKFVVNPRHIEIQVLGDKHGNAIYLGERECSIQRRNQKVIEEAPSPFLDEATRAAMGQQAVALAKAVDYESAGTVEFIVDQDRNFYFLEMNTRLQVEHPVTELVTGIDLVEQMIRVAAGERLSLTQDDITLNGWAIESRIYAEDPYRNFLPSTGRLVRYRPPVQGTDDQGLIIRNDTGVYEGGEISIYYDPMIAKLCTWAPTRDEATRHMSTALDAFYIDGIQHNIPFLSTIMRHPRWNAGALTTGFIAEEFPDGFNGAELDEDTRVRLAAVAAFLDHVENERKRLITGQLRGKPITFTRQRVVKLDNEWHAFLVDDEEGDTIFLRSRDGAADLELTGDWRPGALVWHGSVDAMPMTVQVRRVLNGYRLAHAGAEVVAHVYTGREAELAKLMPEKLPPDTSRMLLCPMPGLMISVDVSVGDKVKAGQAVCVVEAMKMQNVLRAERDAVVAAINAAPGATLAVGDVIMEFE